MKLGKAIRYSINIEPSSNQGFFVKVGCARFTFSNGPDLLAALTNYLSDPEKFEKEYSNSNQDCVEADSPGPVPTIQQDLCGPPG